MKKLKCLALGISFALLVILTVSSNIFAIVTKHANKSNKENVLNIFLESEKEFKKGQEFQNKKDFEKALMCYINSFELCPVNRTHFRIAFCLYSAKFYLAAEKVVLTGLESAKQRRDPEIHFCFLLLLADIYYEVENFDKALFIYEFLSDLAMDSKSSEFIEKRIGETLFKIEFNP